MNQTVLLEEINQLRQRLGELQSQNVILKQRLATRDADCHKKVNIIKKAREDRRFTQTLLHNYAGAEVKVTKKGFEVHLKAFSYGLPKGQYIIILYKVGKNSWQVVGYDLPSSVPRKQYKTVHSRQELRQFLCEVKREVQAFTERKYQITQAEEILEQIDGSYWFTSKILHVFLNLPMSIPSKKNNVCEIILEYEFSDALPKKVSIWAEGLNEIKLERLKERLEDIFKRFSLHVVLLEEYGQSEKLTASSRRVESQVSP